MKRNYLFILFGLFWGVMAVHAQSARQVRPNWPDWLQVLPVAENSTYEYRVVHGMGTTKEDALATANENILISIRDRLGSAVTMGQNGITRHDDIYEIPFNVVCNPYYERLETGWIVYLLCQIAKNGIQTPRFEAFYDCNSYHRWDTFRKKKNTTAIVASTFIPGMGQMLKKQGGSGAAFLISEVALFGGGTACYFLGQEQLKTMKAAGTSYNNYKEAKNMKGTLDIAMYTCFGVGIAVHIANMVHAWYVKDKHLPVNVAFVPAVIPVNEFSTPSYATGAGVQITF